MQVADSLPAIFSAPPPAGPITDQAADAIARLLWAGNDGKPEQLDKSSNLKKNPGISAATDPG